MGKSIYDHNGTVWYADPMRTKCKFDCYLDPNSGSWPLLVIGPGSPYPGREPTLPLVAGPGFGPARHLGHPARPTRHRPAPPTPAARNTLLRLIRAAPPPPEVTPSVLGVDDRAPRKRHS